MLTRQVNTRHCPAAGRIVRVEKIYQLEGTCTCQVDVQIIHWRCLEEARCPHSTDCPLYSKYVHTKEV